MVNREKVIRHIIAEISIAKTCKKDFASVDIDMLSDALVLLKEREGIVPYIDIDEAKCPICKAKLTRQELIGDDVLFEDFFDYCPHCGKPVLWEGR